MGSSPTAGTLSYNVKYTIPVKPLIYGFFYYLEFQEMSKVIKILPHICPRQCLESYCLKPLTHIVCQKYCPPLHDFFIIILTFPMKTIYYIGIVIAENIHVVERVLILLTLEEERMIAL